MAGGDLIPTPLPPLNPSLDSFFIGDFKFFNKKSSTYAETLTNSAPKATPLGIGSRVTSSSIETKLSLLAKGSLQLKPSTTHLGKCSVIFQKSDKSKLIDRLNFVLIAKFSHGRPSSDSIHKFLLQSNIKGDYVLSVFDFKHVIIEFVLFEDFSRIWLKRKWIIKGFPVRFFKWSADFMANKESSIVPVWVHLPKLPLYLYEEDSLLSIAYAIGQPLHIDKNNLNRSKLGYASFCIEMDVSKPPLDELWIEFEDECPNVRREGFSQEIIYVDIPRYCVVCHHLGHRVEDCKSRAVVCLSQDAGFKYHERKEDNSLLDKDVDTTNNGAVLKLKCVKRDEELSYTLAGEGVQKQGETCIDKDLQQVKGDSRHPASVSQGESAASRVPAVEKFAVELAVGEAVAGEGPQEQAAGTLLATAMELQGVQDVTATAGAENSRHRAADSQDEPATARVQVVEKVVAARDQAVEKVVDARDLLAVGEAIAGDGIQKQAAYHTAQKQAADMLRQNTKSVRQERQIDAVSEEVQQQDAQGTNLELNCNSQVTFTAADLVKTDDTPAIPDAKEPAAVAGYLEASADGTNTTRPENETIIQQLCRITREEKAKNSAEKQAKKAALKLLRKQKRTGSDAGLFQDSSSKKSENMDSSCSKDEVVATQSQVSAQSWAVLVEEEDKLVGEEEEHGQVTRVVAKEHAILVEKQVTPPKLSSAAAEFTPKWAVLVEELVEDKKQSDPVLIEKEIVPIERLEQAGQVAGNIDFSAFKARMYRLTGKEEYLAKEDNKEERIKIVSHLSFSEDIEDGYDEESEEGDLDERVGSHMLHGKSILSDDMSDIPRPFQIKSAPNSPKGRHSSYDSNTYLLSRRFY